MGFFDRGDEEDPAEVESLKRIEQGGITRRGEDRLKALSAEGAMFTSGLSVNEFALLGRLGPRPLAQVMGASVVRTGFQYLPALDPGVMVNYSPAHRVGAPTTVYNQRYTEPSWPQVRNYRWHTDVVCELDTLTDAWRMARRRALDRLTEEALQVGADVVVGVHLRRGEHDLGRATIDIVVTGTAIRLPNSTGTSWPLLTDLSVQDYWKLHRAGREPVGLVATTAVMFASPSISVRLQRMRTLPRNRELDEVSSAFHAARDTCRTKLLGQVSDAQGVGAVGVTFSHSVAREKLGLASTLQSSMPRGWQRGSLGIPYFTSGKGDAERRGWIITMHGAGTAIAVRRGTAGDEVKTTVRMRTR